MARCRGRKGPAFTPATPSCNGAILLYEAPTGIAIFSFDGGYLDKQVEDFWACIPQLVLRVFMKYERGSTFIDLENRTIDSRLAKRLTMWCGSKNKLIVGSDEYKKIIETNLAITCLCVDVPDDEVVCGLKNPIHTLLPEEKSETTNKDQFHMGEEAIILLRQHGIDVKPEMVDKYVVEAAQLVHRIELRQKEHLKFLHILLKDFMVISGVDTTKWSLMQFATVPKLICHPEASYQICHPVQIFSYDEYLKIETYAPRYKRSFSKIDALAVYEDVFSLRTERSVTLWKLRSLVKRAKELQEKAEVTRLCKDHFSGEPNRTDLPTTDSYHVEAPNCVEPKQQVIPNQTCIVERHHYLFPDVVQEQTESVDDFKENKQAGDSGDDRKKLTASTPGLLEIKQNGHTGTIDEKMNLPENRDTGVQSMDGGTTNSATEGIPATSETTTAFTPSLLEIEQNGHDGTIEEKMNLPENRDNGVQSMEGGTVKPAPEGIPATSEIATASTPGVLEYQQNGRTAPIVEKMNLRMGGDKADPASSNIPNPEQLKGQHTDTSVKKNHPEINGDDANYEKARGDIKIPATGGVPKSGQLKGQRTGTSVMKPDMIGDDGKDKQDRYTGLQSMIGDKTIPEITSDDEKDKQAREAGVRSMNVDKTIPVITSDEEDTDVQSMDSGKKKPTPVLVEEFTATSTRSNSGFNKPNEEIIATSSSSNSGRDKENKKIPATSKIPRSGPLKVQHTDTSDDENHEQPPASSEIPTSGQLKELLDDARKREAKEASSKNWSLPFMWPMSKGDASSARSGRRPKAMKQTCMPFICCYPVH